VVVLRDFGHGGHFCREATRGMPRVIWPTTYAGGDVVLRLTVQIAADGVVVVLTCTCTR
jgi:hypothetical protein